VRVRGVQDKEQAKYAHVAIHSPTSQMRSLKDSRVDVTLYSSLGHMDAVLIGYMGGADSKISVDGSRADYIVGCHWDYLMRVSIPPILEALYDFVISH